MKWHNPSLGTHRVYTDIMARETKVEEFDMTSKSDRNAYATLVNSPGVVVEKNSDFFGIGGGGEDEGATRGCCLLSTSEQRGDLSERAVRLTRPEELAAISMPAQCPIGERPGGALTARPLHGGGSLSSHFEVGDLDVEAMKPSKEGREFGER